MKLPLRHLLLTLLALAALWLGVHLYTQRELRAAVVEMVTVAVAKLERMELSVDGVARRALVAAPASAKTTRTPVVFAFHGHYGSAASAAREFALEREWPECIVVYPHGLNTPGRFVDLEGKFTGWQLQPGNQGDRDLKFFDAMLARLKQDYQVDDKRIYAFGHSGGGYFTYLLWNQRAEALAAVAPMSSEAAENLPALKPKPALLLAGEKDGRVRYEWVRKTMGALRQLNGCAAEGTPWATHCTLFPSATGTPVVEFVHPGGHEVPAGAIAAIAKFFKETPSKQAALAKPRNGATSYASIMSSEAQQTNERILADVEAYGGGYVWEPESFAVMLLDVAVQDEQALNLCGLTGVQQIALDASRLAFATLQRVAGIEGLQSLVLGGVTLTEDQKALLEGLGPEVEVVATDEP